MIRILFLALALTSCVSAEKRWSFYSSGVMENESVFFAADFEARTAKLLFKPSEIIKVQAADKSMTYEEGKDYTVDLVNGTLKLTEKSRIPCKKLYDGEGKNYGRFKNRKGQKMLFAEGSLFHSLQINVTYKHSGREWDGKKFLPVAVPEKFPNLFAALKEKKCKVALIGDSISVGYNASGFVKAEPHQPVFGPLVVKAIKDKTGVNVQFLNKSRAGATASWGLQNVKVVNEFKPNLVMIAFGMNDGSRPGRADQYEKKIGEMIENIRQANKKVDIILVANMLPNEEFSPHAGHFENRKRLLKLAGEFERVAVADVMSVTEEMLKRKKFADICGNHVNHPNDFLHRVYASVILRCLSF